MSKRGPRFSEKEKLAILKEGKKNGVKAVCAKYEEKRQILEKGYQNGIEGVCAAYRIHDRTYYRWKKKLGYFKSPPRQRRPRRFTKEQVLAMAREAEKTSTKAVREKYKINYSYFSRLRTELTGIRLARRFSPEEKLRILEEGYQNGVYPVCAAYQIDPRNYYNWKKAFNFSKHRLTRTDEERLQIVNEAIREGLSKAAEKHQVYKDTIERWARRFKLEVPWRKRYYPWERQSIIKEAIGNGSVVTCKLRGIDPATLRSWRRKLGLLS